MFFYTLLSRRNLGVLTTWAVDPKLGITFTVDVPCYAWFRRARGPRNQKVAERGYLPSVHRCGIHVVLPNEPWITVLGCHLGKIACNLHIAWKTALFLHTLLELGSSREFLFYHSRLFGLALRLSRSCLFLMPPGNLCHAGGWHLRSRALVLYVRFSRGIFAPRSRDLVVCIPHRFQWMLTSRCGA